MKKNCNTCKHGDIYENPYCEVCLNTGWVSKWEPKEMEERERMITMNRTMKLVFKDGLIIYIDRVENFSICSESNTLLRIKYIEELSEGIFESSAFFDISDLLYFGWDNFLDNNIKIDNGIAPGI